ncbi:MAG: hypothetical protein GY757_54505 [bacterium]|nr:hypothetical protein [bacterium]
MDGIFPLTIFPADSLSQSVITTVWIGVFVVVFFNMRFGWVLSGIIVPGYLVPLMFAKPWAAVVVVLEGIITYLVVCFFSRYMSKWGKWHNLFGRDRFFAMVLVSLLVRIVLDGWLLPELGKFMTEKLYIVFDYQNNLRSFGLIITALIANYFWKPGLKKGMFSMFTIVGVSYILIRYGLMELTNFNIGRIDYMYEELVTSFMASPKAYIIIIVTSFVASWMNLEYGWEYSGIMIPSLLALQWYQPLKLVSTFVEALFILVVASLVMKLPWFREKTIEGGRKLLLFFNIAFLYKFILGHILLHAAPQVQTSDYYGFGYMLSTFIAIKMHQKDILPQMTGSILQTSLASVILASIIGFGLTFVSPLWNPVPLSAHAKTVKPGQPDTGLLEKIRSQKLLLYKKKIPNSMDLPFPRELDYFERGLKQLHSYVRNGVEKDLDAALLHLSQANYRLDSLNDGYLLLTEIPPAKGWGIYIFNTKKTKGIVMEIPEPLDEPLVLEAGMRLFLQLEGSAAAITGSRRKTNWDRSSDVLANPQTFFHTFHKVMGNNNVLQVHSVSARTLRQLVDSKKTAPTSMEPENHLWVKKEFPAGLSLNLLKKLCGEYGITWAAPALNNIQRDHARQGFAELYLNRSTSRRLMLGNVTSKIEQVSLKGDRRIDSSLQELLQGAGTDIAGKHSGLFRPLTLEELLYMDQEILTPLFKLIRKEYSVKENEFSPEGREELRIIDHSAPALGYRLSRYRSPSGKDDYLVLSENIQGANRHYNRHYNGMCAFKLGKSNRILVEVPRPIRESGSLAYGIYMFKRLDARMLMIAGAHPRANHDRSADPLLIRNKNNLFTLANQVYLRESRQAKAMVLSCRTSGFKPERAHTKADIFIAAGDRAFKGKHLSALGKKVYKSLKKDGLTIRFASGSRATMGYEVGNVPQNLYLDQTRNKEFLFLWLSPEFRNHFRSANEKRTEISHFLSLDIPTREESLIQLMLNSSKHLPVHPLAPRLKKEVQAYLETGDIIYLCNLVRNWPGCGFRRIIDTGSGRSFLSVSPKKGESVPIIAYLSPRNSVTRELKASELNSHKIQQFIDSHAMWLILK